MQTTEQANSVLKLGCILMIAGGAATTAISLLNVLTALGSMMPGDEAMYAYIEGGMRDATDGMLGADAAIGIVTGMMAVVAALYIAMLIVDLAVGILGLGRARRPEKHRFFLVWGIILLVIGVPGTLLTGVFSLQGLASLVCGVAAPILFLVGASQQRRALQAAQAVHW